MRRRTSLTIIAATIAAIAALTGCASSGSDLDGTYYREHFYQISRYVERVIIDGENVEFARIGCKGLKDDKTSLGKLNEPGDRIDWVDEGFYSGSDPLSTASEGETLSIGDRMFFLEGTVAAEKIVRQDSDCVTVADMPSRVGELD